MSNFSPKIKKLTEKGVIINNPYSVEIGNEVDPERISGEDVVIYSGTRIYGEKTIISKGSKIGYEAPVTIVDCFLGRNVELKGGFFKSSVFLDDFSASSGAHVREGCILEEQVSLAHTVGLKQTLLFPYVTLGSLINFCDCFMAGGTSRKDHSEVGSSYIHFNYTPNQDKATPSLIGDVPRGVMLNQPPVFLGGQGGLVGPSRIGYGTVIAAGEVYRKDCPRGGKLLKGGNYGEQEKPFIPGFYGDVARRIYNNICYIANLLALKEWYFHIRRPFFQLQEMGEEFFIGLMNTLESMLKERITRFKDLSEKMEVSIALGEKMKRNNDFTALKKEFHENWPSIESCFKSGIERNIDLKTRQEFTEFIHNKICGGNKSYLHVVKMLDMRESAIGTLWLKNIVDGITICALSHLPSFRS